MNPSGNPIEYLLSFAGGVIVSFTPCVYPLIPVSLGYIGAKSTSGFKGFILSFIYVTGIALTYSALGLFASLTGTFFGKVSAHPFTSLGVGIFIVFLGLSMAGLFRIPFNIRIERKHSSTRGLFSVLLLGLISGLVVSPCLTPVLGSILSYLATRKNVFYGMSLLAVFAYGMGFILILCGSFAGLLANLPRSGKWMNNVKTASGILLVLSGVYFIYHGIRGL